MSDRLDNEAFFEARAAAPEPVVEEGRFYAGAERPPPGPSALASLARSPVKFGLVLFVVGWMGILVQRGFFSQVVAGAPLFEEPAKVGAAIALAGLLRVRHVLVSGAFAGLLGVGFAVMEHHLTYSEEDLVSYGVRVAFHGLSAATSMAAFAALEPDPDVRLRWASTLPATLLHYANNFVALVLGIASIAVPFAGVAAAAWSIGVTGLLAVALVLIAARPDAFRLGVGALARRFIPRMRAAS